MLFHLSSLTPNALDDQETPLIGADSLTWNSFAPMSLTPHSMIRKSFRLYPRLPDAMADETDEAQDFTKIALDALPLRPCLSWKEFWPCPDIVIHYTLAPKESWRFIPTEGRITTNLASVSAISSSPEIVAFQPSAPGMMTMNVMLRKRTSVEVTTTGGCIQGKSEEECLALSECWFKSDGIPNAIMSTPKIVRRKKAEAFTFTFISSKAEPISKTAAIVGNIHVVGFPTESLIQPTHTRGLPSRLQNSCFAFPARSKDLPPKWGPLCSTYHNDDRNSFIRGIPNHALLMPTSPVNVFQRNSTGHLGVIPNGSRAPSPLGTRILRSGSQPRPQPPSKRSLAVSPIGIRKPNFRVLTKNAQKGISVFGKPRQQNPKCEPKPITKSVPASSPALSCIKRKRHRRLLETFASIDLDLIEPGVQMPWSVIREMRPNFIGPRQFLPNAKQLHIDSSIKAERTIAHKAVLEQLLSAVERIAHKRKGAITFPGIPVAKKTKFPKNLRNDADLLPFMLLATEAEQRTLETSKSPRRRDNLTT